MTVLNSNAQSGPALQPAASSQRDSMLRRYLSPAPQFSLLGPGEAERAEVESFVAERYRAAYEAELQHFLPWLMTMRCLGQVSGVAGLRPADRQPLFLEQYLDRPLQDELACLTGSPVERGGIVEIGNLVTARRGASHLLFLLFTAVLRRAGYDWIAFTATRALRNNLDKLGFPLLTLAAADIGRLKHEEREDWGSYYATEPLVVVGRLEDAMRIIRQRPLLRRVLRMYRYTINYLADELGAR